MLVDKNFNLKTAPLVDCYMFQVRNKVLSNKARPVRLSFHPQETMNNTKLTAHMSAEEALLLAEQLTAAARQAMFNQ